jgi:hypothetical protein
MFEFINLQDNDKRLAVVFSYFSPRQNNKEGNQQQRRSEIGFNRSCCNLYYHLQALLV